MNAERVRLEVSEHAYRLIIEPLSGDQGCVVEVMRTLDGMSAASIAAVIGHEFAAIARELNTTQVLS